MERRVARQIDELRALRVGDAPVLEGIERETDRVGIGDEVALDPARLRHVDLDLVEVKIAIPACLARDRPDAGVGIERQHIGRAGRGSGRRVSVQRHGFGRGRPQGQRGRARRVGEAQCGHRGVAVVQHALNLHAGRLQESAAAIVGRHEHLPLEDGGDLVQVAAADLQARVAIQVGEFGVGTVGQRAVGAQIHRRGHGGRDGATAAGVVAQLEGAVGVVDQLIAADGAIAGVPGQHILLDPEGAPGGLLHPHAVIIGVVEEAHGIALPIHLESEIVAGGIPRVALVARDLVLVAAGREVVRPEGVDVVAVGAAHQRAEAIRGPIVGAPQILLEITDDHGRDALIVDAVPDPIVVIIEIEVDRGLAAQIEAHVITRRIPLIAGLVVRDDFVLPASGGNSKRPAPNAVAHVREMRRGAVGRPIATPADLALESARQRDGGRVAGGGGRGDDLIFVITGIAIHDRRRRGDGRGCGDGRALDQRPSVGGDGAGEGVGDAPAVIEIEGGADGAAAGGLATGAISRRADPRRAVEAVRQRVAQARAGDVRAAVGDDERGGERLAPDGRRGRVRQAHAQIRERGRAAHLGRRVDGDRVHWRDAERRVAAGIDDDVAVGAGVAARGERAIDHVAVDALRHPRGESAGQRRVAAGVERQKAATGGAVVAREGDLVAAVVPPVSDLVGAGGSVAEADHIRDGRLAVLADPLLGFGVVVIGALGRAAFVDRGRSPRAVGGRADAIVAGDRIVLNRVAGHQHGIAVGPRQHKGVAQQVKIALLMGEHIPAAAVPALIVVVIAEDEGLLAGQEVGPIEGEERVPAIGVERGQIAGPELLRQIPAVLELGHVALALVLAIGGAAIGDDLAEDVDLFV